MNVASKLSLAVVFVCALFSLNTLKSFAAPGELKLIDSMEIPNEKFYSPPTITSNGVIFLPSNTKSAPDILYAFKLNSSNKMVLLDKLSINGDLDATPAVDANGVVYFGSRNGKLYAVSLNNKNKIEILDTYQTGDDILGTPLIGDNGEVYIGSVDSYVYALTLNKKGKFILIDKFKALAAVYTQNFGKNGEIYASTHASTPTGGGVIHALKLDSQGKFVEISKFELPKNEMTNTPIVDSFGNLIVYYSEAIHSLKLDIKGKFIVLDSYGPMRSTFSGEPSISKNGFIYSVNRNNQLISLKIDKSGKFNLIDTMTYGYYPTHSPALGADGVVYVGGDRENILSIKLNKLQKLEILSKASIKGDLEKSVTITNDGKIFAVALDKNYHRGNAVSRILAFQSKAKGYGSIDSGQNQRDRFSDPQRAKAYRDNDFFLIRNLKNWLSKAKSISAELSFIKKIPTNLWSCLKITHGFDLLAAKPSSLNIDKVVCSIKKCQYSLKKLFTPPWHRNLMSEKILDLEKEMQTSLQGILKNRKKLQCK